MMSLKDPTLSWSGQPTTKILKASSFNQDKKPLPLKPQISDVDDFDIGGLRINKDPYKMVSPEDVLPINIAPEVSFDAMWEEILGPTIAQDSQEGQDSAPEMNQAAEEAPWYADQPSAMAQVATEDLWSETIGMDQDVDEAHFLSEENFKYPWDETTPGIDQAYEVGPQDQAYEVGPQDQAYEVGPQDQAYEIGPQDQAYQVGPKDKAGQVKNTVGKVEAPEMFLCEPEEVKYDPFVSSHQMGQAEEANENKVSLSLDIPAAISIDALFEPIPSPEGSSEEGWPDLLSCDQEMAEEAGQQDEEFPNSLMEFIINHDISEDAFGNLFIETRSEVQIPQVTDPQPSRPLVQEEEEESVLDMTPTKKSRGRPRIHKPDAAKKTPGRRGRPPSSPLANPEPLRSSRPNQKYAHMRHLNNIASRKCRQKRKEKQANLEMTIQILKHKNIRLKTDICFKEGLIKKVRKALLNAGLIQ